MLFRKSSKIVPIIFPKTTECTDHQECSICLNNIKTYYNGVLPCGHIFHTDCILKWIDRSNTCPMCRQDLKWTLINKKSILQT